MSTLVILGYVWPEPNSSAAGSRMLELIQRFRGQGWAVIFASAASMSEHCADLAALGVEEKLIAINDSAFDLWLAQVNPQAVLFDRFFTEEQFGWRVEKVCPEAMRLLDTEDLHSLRHARHRLLKQSQQGLAGEANRQAVGPVLANAAVLYEAMATDDMTQRELAAIYRCDLTLMISEFEIDLLHRFFAVPKAILHYCPFLNASALSVTELPSFAQRQHFIAIGNFRHEPNWDAVLYLKYAIWPLIRAQLPSAQLHIYGAYPPPKATQLHHPATGFLVKGWAPDALAAMRAARICLAPLRFGAGIKGKLMDAMRTGTPSVTSDLGAEAMCGDLPWAGVVANDAQAIAQAAVSLYTDESLWQAAQQQGYRILQEFFGSQDHAQALVLRIARLRQDLQAERRQNFTGAMLRHHTLKSTQYMSQWIEAKNRPLPPTASFES